MAKLQWDRTGEHFYETGVKNGVLYVKDNTGHYPYGIVWNGLIAVTESPTGAEANPIYADDIKYLNLYSVEEFGVTIEAYSAPKEFDQCDGRSSPISGFVLGQQKRKQFGFSYKTILGNDTDNESHGYKIHLIYGCMASPSEKAYQTINDSPEAITFSWEITTIPEKIKGYKPVSCITIDSTKIDEAKLKKIEDAIYGTATSDPYLPTPTELMEILTALELVYKPNGYDDPSTQQVENYFGIAEQIMYQFNNVFGNLELVEKSCSIDDYNTEENLEHINVEFDENKMYIGISSDLQCDQDAVYSITIKDSITDSHYTVTFDFYDTCRMFGFNVDYVISEDGGNKRIQFDADSMTYPFDEFIRSSSSTDSYKFYAKFANSREDLADVEFDTPINTVDSSSPWFAASQCLFWNSTDHVWYNSSLLAYSNQEYVAMVVTLNDMTPIAYCWLKIEQ